MTLAETFEQARGIADAVLHEGYLLYPYRASAAKNQVRWQFGVLVPEAAASAGVSEAWSSRVECLLEPKVPDAPVVARVRFLHVTARVLEVPDGEGWRAIERLQIGEVIYLTFDEAAERELDVQFRLDDLLAGEQLAPVDVAAERDIEEITGPDGDVVARYVRTTLPLHAVVRASASRPEGPYPAVRLRLITENRSDYAGGVDAPRVEMLRSSLVAAHSLVGVEGGRFYSLTDPPEWAKPFAADCVNERAWPVMVGDRDRAEAVLASPIILEDWPELAPESPADLHDGLEIDEILTLRTMTMTDEEKAEARATDPRAAAIVDHADAIPAAVLERLHGAIRGMHPSSTPADIAALAGTSFEPASPAPGIDDLGLPTSGFPDSGFGDSGFSAAFGDAGLLDRASLGTGLNMPGAPALGPDSRAVDPGALPWWDPGADSSVSPATDGVYVDGVRVAGGSRVTLRPGRRRADAQDMFLAGRTATVEAVLLDVDGEVHVACVLDAPEDALAAEIARWHGRYLYFAPDELEPLDVAL